MKDEFLSLWFARDGFRFFLSAEVDDEEVPRKIQLFPLKNLWPRANYVC